MDDLISRQAAIDATWEEPTYNDPLNVMTEVRDRLKGLPSVQSEIIRCKDCKWWRLSDYNTLGIHVCKRFSGVRGESDFCSRAEPYKGEQE